jgi:predicted AAA+ superfamily ATPase
MLARRLAGEIQTALADTPVLFLNGARQTGKSTMARELISPDGKPMRYLTLDDAPVLAAARDDPPGFVAGLGGPVVLDEVQRAPDLFLAIKAAVDRKRTAGQFLLTGSADVLLLPNISESLAGRMEIFTLWPLAQGEIERTNDNLLDALFAKGAIKPYRSKEDRAALIERVARGGYPVILQRATDARRRAWFGSYLTTILQRDIRDLSNIEDLTMLPRLLELLATRLCGLLNFADISRSIAIPQTTLKRYFTLLETTFLVQTLHAWSANHGLRLVKSPKVYLNDTGLATYLLGLNAGQLAGNPMAVGPMLENFVLMELRKQAGWSGVRPNFYHFRTHGGEEVDIVLEDAAGNLVGVEVKASASVGAADVKGLRAFAELTGSRFRRGIVFYTGAETVPFAKNIHAMPIESIWRP